MGARFVRMTTAIEPSTDHRPAGAVETPPLSVAPMMERTDRHFRYFMRQLTRRTLLYTEMIVADAILRSDREHLLAYSDIEHPLVLQVGGSEPEKLAECAAVAETWGYDEININVCCPSSRVQEGEFGVCLMADPATVARCVAAAREAANLPVSVKHRIGFDERDSYDQLAHFVGTVADAGCHRCTVHARKAWLDGLSPKDNRNVPPLRYEDVYRLAREFPDVDIELNGGVETFDEMRDHLERVDAVMIGRAAYDRPYRLVRADRELFGEPSDVPSRREVAERMAEYAAWWIEKKGGKLSHIAHHIMHLYSHRRGAGEWRSYLGEYSDSDDPDVIREAADRAESA